MATKPPPGRKQSPPAAGAVPGVLPAAQAPQLCSLVAVPPTGDEWVSEIKFDGYRIIAAVDGGAVRLLTRSGLDWSDRLPRVAEAVGKLNVRSAMLDGELVALRADGVTSFPNLQAALKAGRDDTLHFYAFDLLHLNGWDLRACSLLERKRVLADVDGWEGMLRYSDHHTGDLSEMLAGACRMKLEGLIAKRATDSYRVGRNASWLKLKCGNREELVVLGWSPPGGSRKGIGALHVGYYDPQGNLHYAGGIGTGFDHKELLRLRGILDEMASAAPGGLLVAGDPLDPAIQWVRPELVVETKFTDWSGAGRVRHSVYLGVRQDKPANQVVREVTDPDAVRVPFTARAGYRKGWHGAVPPMPKGRR